MLPPLAHLLQIAVLAGLTSHALFKRTEPRALPFLGLLATMNVFAFVYTYNETQRVVYSVVVSAVTASAFLTGLLGSIVIYRLSPWHPLAEYPGPTLAKLSKWYMAVWIAKGNRHLKLQE
ncbi:hypothetical protein DXG01_005833 [Tephrocybe rancida]|nr:hypothetical protein DXG01_005833 [Tephrocybe rancida]